MQVASMTRSRRDPMVWRAAGVYHAPAHGWPQHGRLHPDAMHLYLLHAALASPWRMRCSVLVNLTGVRVSRSCDGCGASSVSMFSAIVAAAGAVPGSTWQADDGALQVATLLLLLAQGLSLRTATEVLPAWHAAAAAARLGAGQEDRQPRSIRRTTRV